MSFPTASDLAGHDFNDIDGTGYKNHQWMGDVGDVLDGLPSAYDALGAAAAAQAASQPVAANLTTIAGLTATTDNVIQSVSSAWVSRTPAQLKATLALAKGDVGLGNVDNTSDATKNAAAATLTNKSIDGSQLTGSVALARLPTGTNSSSVVVGGVITGAGPTGDASHTLALTYNAAGQLTAVTNNAIAIAESQVTSLVSDLAAKAPLASPALTGTPTAPTATPATNTTQVATTAYADAIAALKANLASPAFTGHPTGVTESASDNSTRLASTAYADAAIAALVALNDWVTDSHTWTYVSSTTGAGAGIITFKIVGFDATAYLYPSVKVSWNDATNTPGYGVIETATFSTDTTVTLIRQSTYVMANHALTAPRYSNAARPPGFPAFFNYNPAYTGFNTSPSSGLYAWSAVGNTITVAIGEATNGATTGGATFPHWSLPAVASNFGTNCQWQFSAAVTDAGVTKTAPGLSRVLGATNTLDVFTDYAGGTWGVAGAGRLRSTTIIYQFG